MEPYIFLAGFTISVCFFTIFWNTPKGQRIMNRIESFMNRVFK